MATGRNRWTVYYDGACPTCVRDRHWYERLAGRAGDDVEWLDITGREETLKAEGIDPDRALRELHVKDGRGCIHRELDAYIVLMQRVRVLRPFGWVLGCPGIRPLAAKTYHRWVARRLRRGGRG